MRWGHKVHTTHTRHTCQLRNIEIKWWWFSFSLRICCRLWDFIVHFNWMFWHWQPVCVGFAPDLRPFLASPRRFICVCLSALCLSSHIKQAPGKCMRRPGDGTENFYPTLFIYLQKLWNIINQMNLKYTQSHTPSCSCWVYIIQLYIGHEWNG